MAKLQGFWCALVAAFVLIFAAGAMAQETTAGLQGTVKDQSGALVPNAQVTVVGTKLLGDKTVKTDNSGKYHFANLPAGIYTVTVKAEGFAIVKEQGLALETGHLPTVDFTLQIGKAAEVVEVSGAAPVIDVTTNQTMTNVTEDIINNVPHGDSYQSMIQFSPMARNEPLAGGVGGTTGNGGGAMPGSSGNGQPYGYSIGGGADSENGYLIEGQDTENISGGYSAANVPFQFIQEVQIKTSGIEAEHGGALGGVVNVIMKKGSNAFHGSLFGTYETDALNAAPRPNPAESSQGSGLGLRYDPNSSGNQLGQFGGGFDAAAQEYQPTKDHYRFIQPGVTIGGPIVKDRLWFFAGFAPYVQSVARTVDFSSSSILPQVPLGKQRFTQDATTYYGTARLDATLTQKVRVFGSWLDQFARQSGNSMPGPDSAFGQLNEDVNVPIDTYQHGIGWSAPNSTYNVGADITLTPKIVSTTRFGYFFQNYHDFGWQTSTPNLLWRALALVDNAGNPLPASLVQPRGTNTAPYVSTYTLYNASKHYQFDQDVSFFKSWGGTHNIKVGYQYNRLSNVIDQNGNVPLLRLDPGQLHWNPVTTTGHANCDALTAKWGACTGQYGYAYVLDFATVLPALAADNNHGLFVQDAWTVRPGLTFNLGVRVEKEYLPAPGGYKNLIKTIDFGWTDKVAPRLGVAWDPTHTGKAKVFGSYGVVNDVMKLLLAQTSYGAQSYEECAYALGPNSSNTFNVADFAGLTFKNGRACPNGTADTQANFVGGTPAALTDATSGVSLIENINLRPWEPSAPGIKPYRQHEYVAGVDYQIARDFAFEARYDRRRLDHILEDASLSDPDWGETYTIVNPGEGVNSTLNGYATYLTSLGEKFGVPGWAFNADPAAPFGTCTGCPHNPKAIRNYDGVELRLTKTSSHGWAGMFSYTYSSLWGNYAGLTNTDQSDGGFPGRNSPDTSRAFDEPFYYFGANGKSNNGPLDTDRPNTFKGYVYYTLPWTHTTFGLFQQAYQGSPASSFIDVGQMFGSEVSQGVHVFGRGKWVNMTQDPTTGAITLGNPYTRRNPWFTQTDFNLAQEFKTGEHQSLGFQVNFFNLLNQRAVTSVYGGMNSTFAVTPLIPGGPTDPLTGAPAGFLLDALSYQTYETGYNVQQFINGNGQAPTIGTNANPNYIPPVTQSSWYGKPYTHQLPRSMRFQVSYNF